MNVYLTRHQNLARVTNLQVTSRQEIVEIAVTAAPIIIQLEQVQTLEDLHKLYLQEVRVHLVKERVIG